MYNKNEYQFINFFRAIASFWVVFSHCMIWGGWYGIDIPDPKMAVDLFMIISGYLMINQVTSRNNKEPMNRISSWLKFFIRRFFRIAPAYYFSLFLAVIFSSYFLGGYEELQKLNYDSWKNTFIYLPSRIDYDIKNILLHITFLFGLDPQYSYSTFLPDWSLSLEMQFYFIFPTIFLLISNFKLKKTLIILTIISYFSTTIINKFLFFYEPSFLLLKLQYFLVGIILYHLLYNDLNWKDRIILVLLSYIFLGIEDMFSSNTLFYIFIFMLMLSSLELNHKLPNFFYNKVIKFMSDTSFSLYLFHGFFISMSGFIISNNNFLNHSSLFIHTIFMFCFVIPLSYVFGYFIFKNIEIRGITYSKYFINRYFGLNKNNEK